MRYYVVRHVDGSFYIISDYINLSEYSAQNHIVLDDSGNSVWFSGDYRNCEKYIKEYSWWNECKKLNKNDAEECMEAFLKELGLRFADKQYVDEYNNQTVVPISSIQDILVEMGVRK